MNQFSSQQRKFVYLGGILALLIPIIWLGLPADRDGQTAGFIAQQRAKLDLGESNLGELDPSGSAMNLVLLGLRGVAANILWVQAEEQKNHKDWAQMRATTESIIRLQPHFVKVWEYNAWNLAYNVSAEWDAVSDRYFWVKEGGKFLQKGVARNRMAPDLYWHVGNIYGKKIGLSDEARYFRRFFRQDPDPRFNGGIDPDWNDEDKDNYLVAKDWFGRANDVEAEKKMRQTIQDLSIFRSYPARAQLDYASALQKYGFNEELDRQLAGREVSEEERAALQNQVREKLQEQTREAWALGLKDWTETYGRELFTVPYEDHIVQFRMEISDEEIRDLGKTPEEIARIRRTVEAYQKMINYRYWRTRALCEAEPETAEMHWSLFAAVEDYRKQLLDTAQQHALRTMTLLEGIFQRYPELTVEEDLIEDGMTALLIWHYVYKLNGERPPADYPLKDLYNAKQGDLTTYERKFNRRVEAQ
uniref:IRE (Iron responsive element) n=1 Tax=Schlesneria paludicola TaxID=360056 RepID=A0A7C2JY30_9PLAN